MRMATVRVGSARIDERGKIYGGRAGDQTGGEIATQAWYRHSKGWILLRANDPILRGYIAEAMKAACANNKIGYDQYQRLTLYNQIKDKDFDPAKATTACETDCSALVRVCVLYAFGKCGIKKNVSNFTTANQVDALMSTGLFQKITKWKYIRKSDYLKRGDILVTRSKGHTVVVMNNGAKAEPETGGKPPSEGTATPPSKRPTLYRGSRGASVREMQRYLIAFDSGFLPKYGVDGSFGAETFSAVKAFQKPQGLEVDGICGPLTWAALLADPGAKQSGQDSEGHPVYGYVIDISDNQGKIDFAKLKNSVDYVIARAAMGETVDSRFRDYAKSMEKNDIPYGTYIFTKAQSVVAAQNEAVIFWNACKGLKPTAFFVDVEAIKNNISTPKERRMYVKTLVLKLRDLGAHRVGLYCGQARFNSSLWRIRNHFDLTWIAAWGKNDGFLRRIPDTKCELHQFTSYGNTKAHNKIIGIPGRVDLDRVCAPGILESLTGRKYRDNSYPGILKVKTLSLSPCTIRAEPKKNAKTLGNLARGTFLLRRDEDIEGWYAVNSEYGPGFIPMGKAKVIPEGQG